MLLAAAAATQRRGQWPVFKIGTDCSGLDAIILAIDSLGVTNYRHAFASDVSLACRNTLKYNYEPEIIYEDLTQRKTDAMPKDLYHAGFPCQPFSLAGSKQGTADPRGNLHKYILKCIAKWLPRLVVLENVKGLVTCHRQVLDSITKKLHSLGYNVFWKVLNARYHGTA
jgi:DNA (cytosine-5)-methyltransferase 1